MKPTSEKWSGRLASIVISLSGLWMLILSVKDFHWLLFLTCGISGLILIRVGYAFWKDSNG